MHLIKFAFRFGLPPCLVLYIYYIHFESNNFFAYAKEQYNFVIYLQYLMFFLMNVCRVIHCISIF